MVLSLSGLLAAALVTSAAAFDFEAACSGIATQVASISNTTVFHTDIVSAGTNLTFPDQDPTCSASRFSQVVLVDMCRVTLNVSTSSSSGIFMETWLPRNWTGRFLSTGNGGLGGCIQFEDMAYATALGFATVVLADFVYRSIHTNVVVGKEITDAFYGSPHNTSYYLGCSTGGRQGWKMVQDFPEDFDGVVAGSPAINFNNVINYASRFHNILGNASSPTFITSDKWLGLIHNNILEQCDTIDGVTDGIIEDPNLCDYKPEELICEPGTSDTSNCLTAEQAGAVRAVFSPMYDTQGQLMFPRQQPGSENAAILNVSYGTNIFAFAPDWYHYAIFDPSLDLNTLNLTDFVFAENLDPFNISTFKGDLSAFQNRGSKVITYHGQADMIISSTDTELYYQHVAQTMGLPPSEIDKFMRFFRISGMSHCSLANGPGAWEIGQTLAGVGNNVTSETLDPERNVLTAIVRWVEEGVAPETILGTKLVNDTPQLGVEFSRRHCRYPFRNVYNGTGDSTLPDSWSCQ
ncbi:hypothetical protein D9757_010498 [Collybiopsis confluens]|uniref:Carboxylic ester hydrolase n=1 Tax=Collybiopsis confluens TaxID=2823264 RepID=A0A8H5GYT3_9AGAR|nr:hypothetical protein D9757_010498 [Collybiopsis confluens]